MDRTELEAMGLSNEEIEALEDSDDELDSGNDEPEDDDTEDTEDDTGDGAGDPDDDDDQDADDNQGDGDTGDDQDAEDNQGDDSDDPDDNSSAGPEPQYWEPDEVNPETAAEDLKAVNQQIADLKTKRRELDKQLEEGDIDLGDFNRENRKLEDQRDELYDKRLSIRETIRDLELQAKYNERLKRTVAIKDQKRFFAGNSEFETNGSLNAALEKAAIAIRKTPEGKNLGQYEMLVKARDQVLKDLGITTNNPRKKKNADPKETARKAKKAAANKAAEAARRSLSRQPNADDHTDGSRFGYLDKLSGLEFEQAVANMTPAEQAAYLNEK